MLHCTESLKKGCILHYNCFPNLAKTCVKKERCRIPIKPPKAHITIFGRSYTNGKILKNLRWSSLHKNEMVTGQRHVWKQRLTSVQPYRWNSFVLWFLVFSLDAECLANRGRSVSLKNRWVLTQDQHQVGVQANCLGFIGVTLDRQLVSGQENWSQVLSFT